MTQQDTSVSNLIINKLTKQQYEGISTPSSTELYFVTDDSGITSSDVTTALGYTPYNATNPDGFISSASLVDLTDTSISSASGGQFLEYNSTSSKWENKSLASADVTTALGYTPYNSTNPSGYISSASMSSLTDTTISSPSDGQILTYDDTTSKWVNSNAPASATWGNITGTLSNQTDLNTALGNKQDTLVSGTSIKTINSTSLLGSGNISVLQNTAWQGTSATEKNLTIEGTPASTNSHNAINIGYGSSASGKSLAIGVTATASGSASIAIGGNATVSSAAVASGEGAIQIGMGTNSTDRSLQIGWGTNKNYQLLDGDTGLIPNARLNTLVGADGTNAGTAGIVPAPTATDNTKFLKGDGTWAAVTAPSPTYDSTNERITWA